MKINENMQRVAGFLFWLELEYSTCWNFSIPSSYQKRHNASLRKRKKNDPESDDTNHATISPYGTKEYI